MMRKIIFINVNILDIQMQQKSYILLLLMLLWIIVCLKNRPFIGIKLNKIDVLSNEASAILLFAGCLYFSDVDEFIKPFIFIIILMSNASFLYSIFKVSFDISLKTKMKNTFLIKMIQKIQTIYLVFKKSIMTTSYRPNPFEYYRNLRDNMKKVENKKKVRFDKLQKPFVV